ncbi:ribonuclease HI family protein [Vagococcus sp.]|uniref:ribonuclease HI family protein n=1 Tax=Vagococcus sp. TaxID=1933889 RepID=UPI003F994320
MIKIFVDAATNPKQQKSAGGMVLQSNSTYLQLKIPLEALDNHSAEFEIMLYALNYCLDAQWTSETIMIYSDSKIVIHSIDKAYSGNPLFQPILQSILEKANFFPLIFFKWIPEKENKGADQLARQALIHL